MEVELKVEVVGQKRTRVEDVLLPSQDMFKDQQVQLSFPLESSFVSDPKDLLPESRKFLLPEDEKRLLSLGRRQASERILHQAVQVLQGTIFLEKGVATLSRKNKEALAANAFLKKELEENKVDHEKLKEGLELQVSRLEIEKALIEADNDRLSAELSKLTLQFAELEDEKENCELAASTAESYKLMKEFLEHKGELWDPEKIIREYEELQALEQGFQEGEKEREGGEGGEEEGESEI